MTATHTDVTGAHFNDILTDYYLYFSGNVFHHERNPELKPELSSIQHHRHQSHANIMLASGLTEEILSGSRL